MSQWLFDTFVLMPNWKWIALVLVTVAGYILRGLFQSLVIYIKEKVAKDSRVSNVVQHFIALENQKTFAWIFTVGFWFFCLDALALPETMAKYIKLLLQILLFFHVIRLVYQAVDAIGKVLDHAASLTANTLDDQLAPFITKSLKVFVIIFGLLLALQGLGFNVLSILAGLGIGGLALAFAAQDTAANVFGSINIILDRPFQIGDHIKVLDVEGTVEEVGFRSTSIRTFYNSLVSIPNAVMAKEKIDNLGMRPARRIRHVIGLEYGTSTDQLQQFIDKVRYLLNSHPSVQKDNITVNLTALGDFNLQILVSFHLVTSDVKVENQVQQEVLLDIMTIAEEMKLGFAFPTQTVHVKSTEKFLN